MLSPGDLETALCIFFSLSSGTFQIFTLLLIKLMKLLLVLYIYI